MMRVLFVDDEPHVLEGLRRMLRSAAGIEAVTATSAEEALRLLAGGGIHAIVSDLRMPVVDGAELLRRVQQQHPEIRRVLLSGTTGESGETPAHAVLRKPCSRVDLLAALSPPG